MTHTHEQGVWQMQALQEKAIPPIPVFSRLMAEMYDDSWYGKLESGEIDYFNNHTRDKRTLEVGSGTGRISIPLIDKGCNLYGVEGSAGMLSILHSKLNPVKQKRFILWDAMDTPYPCNDENFDCVIIPFSTFGLLHHNVSDQLGENRLFHEFYRLLRKNGTLIINDYRTAPFDRSQIGIDAEPWVHYHQHPDHGRIQEEQCNRFFICPNRIRPQQVIRERRTRLISMQTGQVLEEFLEEIPIWDTEDFPILGREASFEYVRGEPCHFHEDPSVHHIFRKV